jgi:hypothetical protein
MSGDRACVSRVPAATVSKRVEVTGPGLEKQIPEASPRSAVRARHAIIGVVARAFRNRVQVEMILQV